MYIDDETRLKHMRDAAQEAIDMCEGTERETLEQDRKLELALVKLVEIVCEAAYKVSEQRRNQLSSIEFPVIVGMRHRLVHGYFDVDLDILWQTIQEDLPVLVSQLNSLNLGDDGRAHGSGGTKSGGAR